MKRKLRAAVKKRKENMKRQHDQNRARNHILEYRTEYCDSSLKNHDSSSDNYNEDDDEKREFEEKESVPFHIDMEDDFSHLRNNDNTASTLLNLTDSSLDLPAHPLDHSGCCGRLWQTMSSFWVLPLIRIGRLRPIQMNDLYALPKGVSLPRVLSKWSSLSFRPETSSILRTIWAIERGDITFVFMLNLFRALIIVGLLYLWQFLIAFYTDPDVPFSSGVVLAIYMFILNLCRSTINSSITNICSSMGTRLMGLIMSIMYDKGLSMDLASSKQQASLNIIGSNLEYIGWGMLYLPSSMVFALILVAISFLFLFIIAGNASYIGMGFVLLIGVPTQIFVLFRISNADDNRFETSDQRVSFMNDLFHGIKFTKLYSWEMPLMDRIAKYREKEKGFVTSYNSNLAWIKAVNFSIPTVMLVLITVNYLYLGHSLHLYIMFQLIIVAQILHGAIDQIPVYALFATEFIFALERIDEFLAMENKTEPLSDSPSNIQRYMTEDIAIKIEDGDFEWAKASGLNEEDEDREWTPEPQDEGDGMQYGLKEISMEVPRGKLIGIIGKVGSGKSSILQAILGEMNMTKGTHYVNGTRNGHKTNVIAYVPQCTFILHGTVRDNILLGLPFNEERYRKVLKYSALEQDLRILAQHDQTEIGEQGVTISGGQKMRISFARALYRCYDSDIFLFDDPLSSVDIDVGQVMFEGIRKFLAGKTRMVVMNSHLFYLRYFDEIYVVNKDETTNQSTIAVKATYEDIMKNYAQFSELMPSSFDYDEATDVVMDGNDGDEKVDEQFVSDSDDDVIEQDKRGHFEGLRPSGAPPSFMVRARSPSPMCKQKEFETGSVPLSVYKDFFWTAIRDFDYKSTWFKNEEYHNRVKHKDKNDRKNMVWMVITLVLLVIAQICDPVADLILVVWTENDQDETAVHRSTMWWVALWAFVILVVAGLRLISGLFMSRWLSRAAFHLNMKTLYYALRAPMTYYDTTPKSAILNRFTKDTNIIDIDLPFDVDIFTSQFLIAASYILIVCIFIPQMIAVFLLISPLFYYLVQSYRATYIELVRLCIFSLDPITSMFGETLIGLSSIRAYKLESYFRDLVSARISLFTNLWYCRNAVFSWFDCYLDVLIDFIVIAATILGFYTRDSFSSPALVAFAIVYLNIISGHLQAALLQLVWVESEFGAVQRMLWYHPSQNNVVYEANAINPEYKLEDKLKYKEKGKDDGDCSWPHSGGIEIKGLKLRYRREFDYVLDIKSVNIKPGEKIGVCGRTGAGKSSLMVALFRLVEPELSSSIKIDGIECTKLGLHPLRKNLTIIPQDPILFMGTLRFNLDPFSEYDDDTIWSVLRKCDLEKVIKLRRDQLECRVLENGANFSEGQKQLICIARALLKNTKCLLLDEATSSIDKHTDSLIQTLIRKHFKSTTVLCIAHRLETILDYDRILVLKSGKIAEFDTPQKLMQNEKGLFYQMIRTVKSHHS